MKHPPPTNPPSSPSLKILDPKPYVSNTDSSHSTSSSTPKNPGVPALESLQATMVAALQARNWTHPSFTTYAPNLQTDLYYAGSTITMKTADEWLTHLANVFKKYPGTQYEFVESGSELRGDEAVVWAFLRITGYPGCLSQVTVVRSEWERIGEGGEWRCVRQSVLRGGGAGGLVG